MSATNNTIASEEEQSKESRTPSIAYLKFPFTLKEDQLAAVQSWADNDYRGTILYSTGTGKTEIAFECARRFMVDYNRFFKTPSVSLKGSSDEPNVISSKTNGIENSERSNQDNLNRDGQPNQISFSFFNILILVPRISLINQTINRLILYGIPEDKIGAYFGERKEKREIIISTYNSVIRHPILIKRSSMVILDEVHLIRDSSKSFVRLFDYVIEDPKKGILGLTATLDENDSKNSTILAVIPPIIKYPIKMAVKDNRLAKPVIIPVKVSLTDREKKEYEIATTKIKNISNRFKRFDANSMTNLLKKGGFASGMAKAWFSNVRKRKLLLSYADNKLLAASNIIQNKFPDEKVMIFSETIESINKLKEMLLERGIESKIIDAKVRASERQRILKNWGVTFNVLLSVHTLEIGYDVPQVRIEIILATTSNINQIIQRIGRVLRKYDGKSIALIYVIYVPDTKDDNVIDTVAKAISPKEELSDHPEPIRLGRARKIIDTADVVKDIHPNDIVEMQKNNKKTQTREKENNSDILNNKAIRLVKNRTSDDQQVKRINKAFQIVEHSLKENSLITEEADLKCPKNDNNYTSRSASNPKRESRVFKVRSTVDKNKIYMVDLENMSCTCADYSFRRLKCKHILATEFTTIEN